MAVGSILLGTLYKMTATWRCPARFSELSRSKNSAQGERQIRETLKTELSYSFTCHSFIHRVRGVSCVLGARVEEQNRYKRR